MHELPHHKTVDSWQRDESTQLTQLTALETLRDVRRGATVLLHPGGTQTQAPGQGAVQVLGPTHSRHVTNTTQAGDGQRSCQLQSALVCRQAPADHLHDVLGSDQLRGDSALDLQDLHC